MEKIIKNEKKAQESLKREFDNKKFDLKSREDDVRRLSQAKV